MIGLALAEALRYVAPDLEEERLPLLVDRYRHHYLSIDQEIQLFGGVADMIEELHASGVSRRRDREKPERTRQGIRQFGARALLRLLAVRR